MLLLLQLLLLPTPLLLPAVVLLLPLLQRLPDLRALLLRLARLNMKPRRARRPGSGRAA